MLRAFASLMLAVLTFTGIAAGASFTFEDTLTYYFYDDDSYGLPYGLAVWNCRLYIGNDKGPLVWFDVSDGTDMSVIDSIWMPMSADTFWNGEHVPFLFHKNTINEYLVNGSLKRYLFQGLGIPTGGVIVYDITDPGATDSTDLYEWDGGRLWPWTQDVFAYDTLIYCSTSAATGGGGLFVLNFSPASETLSRVALVDSGKVCFGSFRIGNYVYLLEQNSIAQPLIMKKLSASNYSVICADTSAYAPTTGDGESNSFVVAVDTFEIDNSKVMDTIAFAAYPATVGGNPMTVLWVVDLDSSGTDATVLENTSFLSGEHQAFDTKYANRNVLFSFNCCSTSDLFAYDVTDIDNITLADSLSGVANYDFAIRPNEDGSQDVFVPMNTDSTTVLLRYEFSDNDVSYIPGDYTANGRVNIADATAILNYCQYTTGYAAVPLFRGDANGDGYVNLKDYYYILWYIFNGGSAPRDFCED